MPNYRGRRAGTRRVVITTGGRQSEWIVEGTKAEGAAFEARKRVELGERPSSRTAPTFRAFCEDVYAPHAETHLRRSTWWNVRRYQVATLCEHLGDVKLDRLSLEHVEAMKGARAKQVKASSANNELRVLHTILEHAKALRYPCAVLAWKKLPTRGPSRVRVWSAGEIGRLFDAARKVAPELVPLLVFLANTGCRKGEAIAAEWSWFHFDRAILSIPSNEAWRPKSGRAREVPISNALRAALSGGRGNKRWTFPTQQDEQRACFPEDLFRRVAKAAKLAGGPHTLRHSFASLFLASCPDMFLLAQILGHSHTRVTELYSHLLPDHLDRAKNVVDIAPRTAVVSQKLAATMAKGRK